MTMPTDFVNSLWKELRAADTTDCVILFIQRINKQQNWDSTEQEFDLRYGALKLLMEFSASDANSALGLISTYLLPQCLKARSGTKGSYARHKFNELLANWIESYSDEEQQPLLNKIISLLSNALEDTFEPACYALSKIGFQSPDILENLWKVAVADRSKTIHALATIISIGGMEFDRERIIRTVMEQPLQPLSHQLTFILSKLASPKSLNFIADFIRVSLGGANEQITFEKMSPLSLPSKIADRYWQDDEIQQNVAELFKTLCREYPSLKGTFLLSPSISTIVNSSEVVKNLIEQLSVRDGRNHWLIYERLKDCVRPRQLDGWKFSSHSLTTVLEDALSNAKSEGPWETEKGRLKHEAWETMFCLGIYPTIEQIEMAIGQETNGFVQQEILNTLAAVRCPGICPAVKRLVLERYDYGSGGKDGELGARIGAIRYAQSVATKEAFDILIDVGVTFRNELLVSTAEALSEIAVNLVKAGDNNVIDQLLQKTLRTDQPWQRSGALFALRELSRMHQIESSKAIQLMILGEDTSLRSFERGRAVEAVAWINHPLSREVMNSATKLLEALPLEPGWQAMELLIRHGRIEDVLSDVTAVHLGIKREGNSWHPLAPDKVTIWQAHLLGLLTKTFSINLEVVNQLIIEKAESNVAYALIHNLYSSDKSSVQVLSDALVGRMRLRMNRYSVETRAFAELSQLNYRRLFDEEWHEVMEEWHPEARIALANTLGQIGKASGENELRHVLKLLIQLARNGMYAVRRASYRAIARLDPDALDVLIMGWSDSTCVADRKRAAEALAWVRPNTPSFEVLVSGLLSDPKLSVRDTTGRSQCDARERQWSLQYLEQIFATNDNDDLPKSYVYGRALVRMPSDEVRDELERHLVSHITLPSHIRYWIKSLVTDIDKAWRKRTSEWDEIWFEGSGVVEELDGKVTMGGTCLDVKLILSHNTPQHPSDLASWNGIAFPSAGAVFHSFIINDGYATIEVVNRNTAKAVVTSACSGSRNWFALVGSGPYPSLISRTEHPT